MVDKTIPDLDAVATPAPTDRFGVRQAGDTEDRRETRAQVHTLEDGEYLVNSFTDNITAFDGGGQGSAVQLTSQINFITDVNNAGDSVRLPSVFPFGAIVEVHCRAADDSPDVFPASGDDLGQGVDTALRIAPFQQVRFIATVANSTWERLFQELIQSEAVNGAIIRPNVGGAGNSPSLIPDKRDLNTGIGTGLADLLSLIAGGNSALNLAEASGQVKQQHSIDVTVTAFPTGGQGSAVELLSTYNIINVVGTAGDSVRLPPTFQPGTLMYVMNPTVNSVDVFPSSGDDLGQGTNNAAAVAGGATALFIGSAANATWIQAF